MSEALTFFRSGDLEALRSLIFLGNTLEGYMLALIVLVIIYVVFRFAVAFLLNRLEVLTKKTKNEFDDGAILMLEKNRWMIFVVISLFYLDFVLSFPSRVEHWLDIIMTIAVVYLAVRVINFWVGFVAENIMVHKQNVAEQTSIGFLSKVGKIIVWIFGGLFLISSFGYNITSLVAGLGIGGIAVALAVQNVLADLISCISIYLDKPFKVGDFIVLDKQMGTVKNIGIKTTRITSLQGEEIVVSNKRLTESDINNFGRMKKRRVVVNLGVTYDTPLEKMKTLSGELKKIINPIKDTTFDRAHFKTFGDFSKIFELVFYVESNDYYAYMDRLEEVNLKIQELFEKKKIQFAYPTQTVYVEK